MLPNEACQLAVASSLAHRCGPSSQPRRPPEPSEPRRIALNCSTGALRAAKVDRQGRPGGPETRFSTISDRFWDRFSSFFEATLRERHDSWHECANP